MNEQDRAHLQRCIELATEALNAGDAPFGSVLVDGDGNRLAEDRNRAVTDNVTHHPEFELARWAARNLDPAACAAATVYTSGEHCPMCAAAHAMAGLGRIVYIMSSRQFAERLAEFGHPPGAVRDLSVQEIAPGIDVVGPVTELVPSVLELYQRRYGHGETTPDAS
ncbi:nucleoside deaminase [Halofilum ochraceum]|uniref:nucleoside deaminase n=1 Tax=Halofilum ochraceum TaxID=1611323 RepID=UPI0008DA22DE|nr:nucleoside deaminase [Halofilum ochraceum]